MSPKVECMIDEGATAQGLTNSEKFVQLIDASEKLESKNVLIVSIREDGAIEAYCNLERTEVVEAPNEFMMLASIECCSRQMYSSQGKKMPKSGTQEWAQEMARILMRLAKKFMSKIED